MEEDLDLVYTSFYREYRIDLLSDNLSFKKYKILLHGLSSDSDLMRVISLRSMSDHEIKNPDLLKIKRQVELKSSKVCEDPLKKFSMLLQQKEGNN